MSSSLLAAILIPIAVAVALANWIFFSLSSRRQPELSPRPPATSGRDTLGTVRPGRHAREVSAPADHAEP
jgi:hypothetical protein